MKSLISNVYELQQNCCRTKIKFPNIRNLFDSWNLKINDELESLISFTLVLFWYFMILKKWKKCKTDFDQIGNWIDVQNYVSLKAREKLIFSINGISANIKDAIAKL